MKMSNLAEQIKRHKKQLLIGSAVTFVTVILLSVLLLPLVVKSVAEKGIGKALGRTASLEKVSFNPFGMTLTIQRFTLFEPDRKTPFVSLGTLRLSLSSATLYRFAPVVDELTVDQLQLKLARTAENRYNFSDILEHLAKQPKKETSGDPVRFSVNNINILNSELDFNDLAVSGGKQHTVKNIKLAIPFISNIPHLAKLHTNPAFSAVVNGAPITFSGKTRPFHESVETELDIKLSDLELPRYQGYLPMELPVKLTDGKVTLDLHLLYVIHKSSRPELSIKGLTRLDQIKVTEKDSTAVISFNRLDIVASQVELFSQKVALQQILLDGATLNLLRNRAGNINLLQLADKIAGQKPGHKPGKAGKPEKTAKKPDQPAPQLMVDEIWLKNGLVTFYDQQPEGGFRAALKDIELKIANLATEPDKQGSYELSFNGDAGESFRARGTATVTPVKAFAEFDLANLKLQKGWPYLQQFLTSPVKGELAVTGKAGFNQQDGATVENLTLKLKGITADYGDKDGVKLDDLELSGISFSQKEQNAVAENIALTGGNIKVSRESDGSISLLKLLKQQPDNEQDKNTEQKHGSKPETTTPSAGKKPATGDRPFTWQIKNAGASRLNLTFKDKIFEEPTVLTLTNTGIEARNINGPTLPAIPFTFSSTFNRQAPVSISGSITAQPFRFSGVTSLKNLPLLAFENYIPDNVRLYLLSGLLDSNIKVDISLDKDNRPMGSFSGSTGIRSFHVVDAEQEEDLLKWESLQLDKISGSLEPFSLHIGQVALNNVYSRVAIRKDGTLNLQNLVVNEQKGGEAPKQAEPAKGTVADGGEASKGQVRVDAVTIQDGTMAFSDEHLPGGFHTTFYKLGGRVSGLSSDMNSRAEVDLRGDLENHSPLLISGTINPLRDDLFVDLTISFRDIELAPATPYSGTYLGYEIDKGKLFLDLKYHIENKQLEASNKVLVDQFTFGKTVESDKATKLPVRLGVALLKDRNGQIKLDLPLEGRTDDPQFNIWGVVWKVVTNLFVKAVTSPFSLLSSMFGSGEDLSHINFTPGSATLTAEEEKKLLTLATALEQRPGLNMEISGFVNRERDPEGYRNELLTQKMRQEKYLELAKKHQIKDGEDATKMVIQPAEYSQYLKAVYQKEKFPKPRNILGMAKTLPDDEMKKLIITNTPVGDRELQQLAEQRAVTVRQTLVSKGKLPSERIFLKKGDIDKLPTDSKQPANRVELIPVAQ